MKSLSRRLIVLASLQLAAAAIAGGAARAASLQPVTSFGNNPTGLSMYIFVPDQLAPSPPVLVALHPCGTPAPTFFGTSNGTGWATLASQYGFIVIYPETTARNGCWDAFSTASLSHGGGGDTAGIVSMIQYALTTHSGDRNRVYAAGHSVGGVMTIALLGAYPDVFKAGASFAGAAFGCWADGVSPSTGWSSSCAGGTVSKTAQQWGNLVRAAYPTYSGSRPRVQIWHGDADANISFNNFGELIKQWTNVHGLSETPTTTETIGASTRTRYADASTIVRVEAVQLFDGRHSFVDDAAAAIRFFGLDQNGPDPGTGTGGASGTGGQSGTGGTSGAGGRAGSGGTSGAGGRAGGGGTSGAGGRAGSGGTSGVGGRAGSGGTSGAGGQAGNSGTPGAGGMTGGTGGASGYGGRGGATGSGGSSAGSGGRAGAGAGGTLGGGGVTGSGGGSTGSGGGAGGGSGGGAIAGGGGGPGGSSGATGSGGTGTRDAGADAADAATDSGARQRGLYEGTACALAEGEQAAVGSVQTLLIAGAAFLIARRRRGRRPD